MIQIAVLGYGTIGSGVAEVLKVNKREYHKTRRRRNIYQVYPGSA